MPCSRGVNLRLPSLKCGTDRCRAIHVETRRRSVRGIAGRSFVEVESDTNLIDHVLVERVNPLRGEVVYLLAYETGKYGLMLLLVKLGAVDGKPAKDAILVAEVMIDAAEERIGVDRLVDCLRGGEVQGSACTKLELAARYCSMTRSCQGGSGSAG